MKRTSTRFLPSTLNNDTPKKKNSKNNTWKYDKFLEKREKEVQLKVSS